MDTRKLLIELTLAAVCIALAPWRAAAAEAQEQNAKPNIIFVMADDMGWGDTGYNGHPVIKTPNLDRMASDGLQFNRFYSAGPVCSPTRGSVITGRHPYRYGVYSANRGHIRSGEITIAEALKPLGYATGHFGKWHLGAMSETIKDGRRGGKGPENYSTPWDNGFDVGFSTECQVPTWNPMENQSFPAKYWTGKGQWATDNLEGDDSRIIMDRAIPFIEKSVKAATPFLALIWFHTPHTPVVAGPPYRAMYPDQDVDHQDYYGCITAMDEQIGRLRAKLEQLGAANNTMLWFCSDNGPARQGKPQHVGSPGPFRGFKSSLYEGGVRVPGLLVWPAKIKQHRKIDVPCVTSDYFPTVLATLGYHLPQQDTRPYDGVDLTPIIEGKTPERPRPIGFQAGNRATLSGNRYKIVSGDKGQTWELYDLLDDPGETTDLAQSNPGTVTEMASVFEEWRASCAASDQGGDYEK